MTNAAAFTPPPLPAGWPYEPRTAGPPLAKREGEEIPGFGGGWTLLGADGLHLSGGVSELSEAFGRGGVRRAGHVVIRPYRRGGLLRRLNERTYPSEERFLRELDIHRALHSAGFPTVEPLGCAWRPHRWGMEGLYLTRFEAAAPWPRAWERSGEVLPRLREAIAALADWGLHAPDLNATNILLKEEGGIVLLDWDRAAFLAEADLRAAYCARLARSLSKLGAPEEAIAAFR